MLIAFGLFFVEMHFVGEERKSHDAEQAELRKREETTRREQNPIVQPVDSKRKASFQRSWRREDANPTKFGAYYRRKRLLLGCAR